MRLIDADALHEALNTKQKWVVRCGDKHNEGYTYDQVHFAIEEAPTIDAVSEWIPCSKRLPSNFSEDETVLATTDVDGDRVIAMFALDVKSFYLKGYVSAWMPLPTPWKGADDE